MKVKRMSNIDLIALLPFKLGFLGDAENSDLNALAKELKTLDVDAEVMLRKYPTHFSSVFNQELRILEELEINCFTITISYFGFGVGYIKACYSLIAGEVTKQAVIKNTDSLWDEISFQFSKKSRLFELINSLVLPQSRISADCGMSPLMTSPKLLDCYSQTLLSTVANASVKKNIFGKGYEKLEQKTDLGSFICLPAINFVVARRNRQEDILNILSGATLNMALLYDMQSLNLNLSRQLLTKKSGTKSVEQNIDLFDDFVSSQNQLIEEIKSEDFLGTDIEELIGRPLFENWKMDALIDRASQAIEHLGRQVDKAKDRLVRKTQRRQTMFFLFFTVLTVVSVTADILGVYDFKNELDSNARLAVMSGIFVISLFWALFVFKER
jgi:hypothetical protein